MNKNKELQQEIRNMLGTHAWKLIEEDYKNYMVAEYNKLFKIKPEKLREQQMKVRICVETISRIYQLAGLKWLYDGYSDLNELMQSEKPKERQLLEDELKEITNG